jgi:hypothetical protein
MELVEEEEEDIEDYERGSPAITTTVKWGDRQLPRRLLRSAETTRLGDYTASKTSCCSQH